MKISIDTKEDSHEEIRKVVKMLQNLVGDSQEVFTNEPQAATERSPFANIFGDTSSSSESTTPTETSQETAQETSTEESSESTEDLFAELFSEEELKKMNEAEVKEEEKEEVDIKPKDKKHKIEFF